MSRSDGCHRVGLGGLIAALLLGSVSLAEPQGKGIASTGPAGDQHGERQKTQEVQHPNRAAPSAPPADRGVQPPGAGERGQQLTAYEVGDLEHSRRATEAAEEAVLWTRIGTVIAGIGTVLVLATLIYTGKATNAAKKAADAAHLAIDHERESTERALRPYIFVEKTMYYWIWDEADPDKLLRWRFNVMWKNVGQTPAARVKSRANVMIFGPLDMPTDFDFPDVGEPSANNAGGIGPGQGIENVVFISISDLEAVRRGEKSAYIWAWAEYDGFPDTPRRRTEWHGRVVPLDSPSKKECLFQFIISRSFNGYDESCARGPQALNI